MGTDKRRKSMASDKQSLANLPSTLDKILLANDVAEMLITNWRAIVYEMKHMGIMRKESMLQHTHHQPARVAQPMPRSLRPSRSETFTDHNMGSMVQQASQLYSSNLRKTRSASNTRNAIDAMSAKQPPPPNNVPAQRPADMSFEEFAARKKLRNYASNMSIASDSTYSAIEPQPVKPLSPPVEDPFYVPGAIAISTRSGAAKLTKQRRTSGGFSTIFGGSDKTATSSPTKDLPKIARKAVNSHSDSRSFASEGGDKIASPWNVSLSPTKVRGGALHEMSSSNRKYSGSPRKATPTRAQHRLDPVDACRSEPAGRVGIGIEATPQSKTAALIAKIMNTKQQQPPPTPTPVKKTKTVGDLTSRKDKTPRASHDTPKIFESKSASNSPIKNHGNWTRENATPVTKSENRPIEPTAIVSPTPRRPWKAQASASVLAHGRDSPQSTLVRGSDSPATRPVGTVGGLGNQSLMHRSNRAGKPSVTPQRKPVGGQGIGAGLVKGGVAGLKNEEKPARHTTQQRALAQLANDPTSPLSEIKNDARNLTRANSNSSRASKRTQTDGITKEEPKSPAPAGSSVKAMAAMFDTAAWKSSDPLPLTNPQVAKPHTPKRGSALSQYTSNMSPSKTSEFVTPPHSPIQPKHGGLDKTAGRGTDSAAMQRTASERRRLRLTKSEGRNGPLGKVGRLAASERRELARSVDRNEAKTDSGRRTPFGLAKDSASPSKDSASANLLASGKLATTLPASDNTSSLARGGTPVSSRAKGRPVSAVLAATRPASTAELQRLLDNKTSECDNWKTRAEAAEAKVAELELALARASVTDASSKIDSFVSVTEQGSDLSWAWQNLLPETDSIHLSQEKLEISSTVREIGETDNAMPAPLKMVSRLRKDFETDDSNGSETSSGSGARGRLMNKRLLPFSM
ncbi:hypothetical protein Sste5346_002789 [Sporothrix stenoceras]|uniref:Uncharacterized protein n=1 Tax=Sporothrix stenoceras TaxID=5173 RepID=A0ABR3ZJC3_9PEZI